MLRYLENFWIIGRETSSEIRFSGTVPTSKRRKQTNIISGPVEIGPHELRGDLSRRSLKEEGGETRFPNLLAECKNLDAHEGCKAY